MSESVTIELRADNSNGCHKLIFTHDEGEMWANLCGVYKGERIQIDFDMLTRSDMREIIAGAELMLEAQP